MACGALTASRLPWSPKQGAAIAAFFFALSLVVYWPVLQSDAGFVWDDSAELWGTRGHFVLESDGPLRAWWPIEKPEAGWHRVDEWRPVIGTGAWPLTPTVLWTIWRVSGAADVWEAAPDRPAAVAAVTGIAWRLHLPGVLLHAVTALLFVAVLRRLAIPGAALCGTIFLVHPLCVPSVAWVSELKNTLSLPLLLLALLAYLRWREDDRGAARHYGLSLFFFWLSLTAKSSGVGFPAVLVAVEIWCARRFTMRQILPALPFMAVGLVMGLLTLWFTAESGGLVELGPATPKGLDRLSLALQVPWFYLGKFLWPSDLTMIYPGLEARWTVPWPWLSLAALALIGLLAIRRLEGFGAAVLAAALVYGAMLFPVLGLFRMTYAMHAPVADHLAYAALLAPIALLGGGAASWVGGANRTMRRTATTVGAVVVVLLAVLAHDRVTHWKNHESLWTRNVAVNPDAWMARYNLGTTLWMRARELPTGPGKRTVLDDAARHLSRAIQLEPRYAMAHHQYAIALGALGRQREALVRHAEAVAVAGAQSGEDSVQAASLRGEYARALFRADELGHAEAEYRAALGVLPTKPALIAGLARVHERRERDVQAAALWARLLKLDPSNAGALAALAWLRVNSEDERVRDLGTGHRLAERAYRALQDSTEPTRSRAQATWLAAQAEYAHQEPASTSGQSVRLAERALEAARRSRHPRSVAAAERRLLRIRSAADTAPPPADSDPRTRSSVTRGGEGP